jgi:hypothetical protein
MDAQAYCQMPFRGALCASRIIGALLVFASIFYIQVMVQQARHEQMHRRTSFGLVLTWHRPGSATHPKMRKSLYSTTKRVRWRGNGQVNSATARGAQKGSKSWLGDNLKLFNVFYEIFKGHVMRRLAWRSSRFRSPERQKPRVKLRPQALIKQSRFCRRREGCSHGSHHY